MPDTFKYEYPQTLNLDKYDVFLEQPLNDTSYIFIDRLPHILTYGKHFGTLSWRSPENTRYQIKHGSQILFELKDNLFAKVKELNIDIIDLEGTFLNVEINNYMIGHYNTKGYKLVSDNIYEKIFICF